jgi:sporulation protein YlmC with PRC-barrel domain
MSEAAPTTGAAKCYIDQPVRHEQRSTMIERRAVAPVAFSCDTWDARSLIGTDFKATDEIVLGHIDDFMIDPANHRVTHVVVSDVVGLGAERVMVPFETMVVEGSTIRYNPPSGARLADEVGDDYHSNYGLDYHYGLDRYAHSGMPQGSLGTAGFFGDTIRTADGRDSGRIEDVVFDSNGNVVFLVLTDIQGVQEDRMVFVPYSRARYSGDVFIVDMPHDRLIAAPAYAWDDFGNRTYVQQTYTYFGLQPCWGAENIQ